MLELPENSAVKAQLAILVAQVQGKSNSNANGVMAAVKSVASAVVNSVTGGASSIGNGAGHSAEASASGNGAVHRGSSAADVLAQCRELAMKVHVPKTLRDDLATSMKVGGGPWNVSSGLWMS